MLHKNFLTFINIKHAIRRLMGRYQYKGILPSAMRSTEEKVLSNTWLVNVWVYNSSCWSIIGKVKHFHCNWDLINDFSHRRLFQNKKQFRLISVLFSSITRLNWRSWKQITYKLLRKNFGSSYSFFNIIDNRKL